MTRTGSIHEPATRTLRIQCKKMCIVIEHVDKAVVTDVMAAVLASVPIQFEIADVQRVSEVDLETTVQKEKVLFPPTDPNA